VVTQVEQNNLNGQQDYEVVSQLSFCILWSPIPMITWLFPFVGHLGIADSRGVVYDFQGPYSIGVRTTPHMAFGSITRKLFVGRVSSAEWDRAIYAANDVYKERMHNLFCDNCHSHVANALNQMDGIRILGFSKFNMVNLAIIMFFKGRFLSLSGLFHQFLPFVAILLFALYI